MKNRLIALLLITLLIGSCASPTPPTTASVFPTILPSQSPRPTQTAMPSHTPTRIPTATNSSTPTPTFTAFPYPIKLTDPKGVVMALVPAGEFIMGNNNGQEGEKPVHIVYLDVFYIDIYEVTNKQYKDCVDAGVCQSPQHTGSNSHSNYYGNSQYDNYPVIYVNWNMAKTYCEWRQAKLPTEAQWEKAARGTDGRTYPWGEEVPDCSKANYSGPDRICVGDTTAIGSYESGKSPYGIYDMAGNVWEWVTDWYSETYYRNSPAANPLGPDFGQVRVVRGGAWLGLYYFLQASGRHSVSDWQDALGTSIDVGFRCSHTLP